MRFHTGRRHDYGAVLTTGALQRTIRQAAGRAPDPQHCDLCQQPVQAEHRHLLDTDATEVLCSCQACSLLFNRSAASDGHYRLLPDRRVALHDIDAARLGVPVGLAFFVVQPDRSVLAHYPSPGGATRWQIEPRAWRDVVAGCPDLGGLADQVEALLVDTTGQRREAWIVPLDDCYRLVAIVRREWKGITGGDRVGNEIGEFFDELRRRYGQYPGR
jgi:hypothetical protein